MLIFKIIYYCYFSVFDLVVFGQINREFVVKLLSLALMAILSAMLLTLFTHYTIGITLKNDITFTISMVFILLYYVKLVHKERHKELVLKVKKIQPDWKIISYFLLIYSLTFLIFFLYFNMVRIKI
jgi:hypothetical protein